ncbi:MAG TPA: hypothetical protein PKA37_05530 [Planctomycetota bacterium]|jgi:hypothetical protein|nr:hypothetical protein [Planctomycetota bacterium]
MKITLTGLALAFLALSAIGQTNEEKYNEKLKKDFVSKISWETDLAKAKERAAKEGKLIFGYFTRSYAP